MRARFPTRRELLALAGLGGAGLVGLRCALPGLLRPGPVRPRAELSPAARALVERCFADVDPALVWDAHVHVVGLGTGGSGCAVGADMRSHLHPVQRLQFDVYLAASGVTDLERADEEYLERALALQRAANPAGRAVLLAFDRHVAPDGREVPERSPFYTPDAYVLRAAAAHAEAEACASVHPYRRDALERLEIARAGGAVAVKWLPNAMGIDPADRRCDAYYERLLELGLPLLTHTGLERAVHAADAQRLGNPLRLRRPLDAGVRVIMAHCATLGEDEDLDAGAAGREVASFELFLRLMAEERYVGLAYGELSAVTLVNRSPDVLRRLVTARELHARLVNGSDYPLPAIDPLVSTRRLVAQGFLTAEERRLANEVFEANPLLFDYVVKRLLAVREGGREQRFAPAAFESGRALLA